MADFPTRAELFQIGADEMIGRGELRPPGSRVSPEELYTEGSDVNLLLAGASAMGEEAMRHVALRTSSLFFATAEREALDRLVADRLSRSIVRLEASAALVELAVSQAPGGPVQVFDVGTRFRTEAGVEFRSLHAVTLGAGDTGPVTVRAQASQTGTSGNVDADTIRALVQPRSGVSVTNPARAAGGDDQEPDARLRARAQDFFPAARRGTLGAIEFGARTVPGVRLATALEIEDEFGRQTGHVQLYVSDAAGAGNALLAELVRTALRAWRAAGIYVDVVGATPRFEPVVWRLRFATGIDSTIAFDAVRRATIAAVNRLAPQTTLERSALFEAARSVEGVIVRDDAIVAPVGDVVPATGEVIRTRLDLVTAV